MLAGSCSTRRWNTSSNLSKSVQEPVLRPIFDEAQLPMYITCEGFTSPKDGSSEAQNDDAFMPRKRTDGEVPLFRCAIADGATESLFAGRWARLIAWAFKSGRLTPEKRREETLCRLQQCWTRFLHAQDLPWYAASKAAKGSFATLMGLELRAQGQSRANSPEWSATALGDSCLFLIREGELRMAFPIAKAVDFNNQPHLLASSVARNTPFEEWLITRGGELCSKDTFYLMTDALSFWFLREHAEGRRPWNFLRSMGTSDVQSFSDWVSSLRDADDRLNDDATMIRIKVESVR